MTDGAFSGTDSNFRQLWRENHGNFLLLFAGVILVVGGILLAMPPKERARVITTDGSEPPADSETALSGEVPPSIESLESDQISTLKITVLGVDNGQGKVRVATYRTPGYFNQPDYADEKAVLNIKDNQASWEIAVPAGYPVAISAFHDQNSNGVLDRNLIGIPIEEYGFSRGARSQTGPPPFADAAIIPPPGTFEVELEVW